MSLTPLDGRYRRTAEKLAPHLSEFALIRHRLQVMTEYLIAIAAQPWVTLRAFTATEVVFLRDLQSLSLQDAKIVKAIEVVGYGEHKKTNHDVKACELYLRDKLAGTSLADAVEWIHFGLTSEDVNNLAYALMLRGAVHYQLVPAIETIFRTLREYARQYADLPMLARTHGQSATPTTLGKEFNVFASRLHWQREQLRRYEILVKLNSASGNYNALHLAFPKVEWVDFTQEFIRLHCNSDPDLPKLQPNYVTTQIEPHDTYAELFGIILRLNTLLIDTCHDIWQYISDEWLVQAMVAGEAGSSIMPHKVNPIDFENAEGNFVVANALLEAFCRKLPISRLQRDLSDSTVERCFGMALGHSLKAYESLAAGLAKISANEVKIVEALNNHPEVVTEAYQTILRTEGYSNAYATLRDFARGKRLTLADLHEFVRGLDIPWEVRDRLLCVTPSNYIGLAPRLARM